MKQDTRTILDFWFRELTPGQWFFGGDAVDRLVQEQFETTVEKALEGEFDDWATTPRGRLALILVLDQFTRNIYRNDPKAYIGDHKAQKLALEGVSAKEDEQLTSVERHFFYMPLMHAEDKKLQALSVQKFTELKEIADNTLGFAQGHSAIVERFGRFPHRNKLLDRASTQEEEAFLRSDENIFR